MDLRYAKAYMTERLEEAENRRLVDLSRQHRIGPAASARHSEQWFGKLRRLSGAAPAGHGSAHVTLEATCCAE